MKSGDLCRVSIGTEAEAEEAVAELLQRIFRQPASTYTNARSGRTAVSVYIARKAWNKASRADLRADLQQLKKSGLSVGRAATKITTIRRQDWAESWKRHFRPLAVGSALLIKPSWSKRRPRSGQAVVILDPGLSFGTGQHPTTGFCLQQLVRWHRQQPPQACLDIGTGSGILAISAAKLGYRPVHALDHDPDAIRVARANARQNGMSTRISFHVQDLTKLQTRHRYSVVCANLIAPLLLSERKRIRDLLVTGGVLIVAGILKDEFERIQSAYETTGFCLLATRAEREWRSGAFRWRSVA
jgi:ribosomal protein L11 methyltransferase